jgi:phage portal protein BeeE
LNAASSFFVYGNIFVNKVVPVGFRDTKELYILPSNRVYIKTLKSTGDLGYIPTGTDPRSNPITGYNWDLGSTILKLDPSSVIHIKDSNLSSESGSYLYGQSRLFSATRNIQGISSMVDTINTILSKNGGLGFVKKNKKPNEIDGAIDPLEKERIESAFMQYGLTDGRQPVFFTDQDLQYVKMSSALAEFMPTQIKESEFRMLCNVLGGFPANILNDTASSTYNNIETAHKALYMNIVKPFVELFYEALSEGLGLTAMGEYLKPCFDDVEVLQPDKKLQAETEKLNDEVQKQRYNDDLITLNEWLHEVGLEPVEGGDKKRSEMQTEDRPIASDIGVGGVQAMQSILADPNMSDDSKVYTIVYVFGIDESKARQMVGTKIQGNDTNG